ncbi:hypothetical protein [Desertivirga xinjiangensis]|uniref:hypothetical protein n=1 Tax=Desertivirga xinjiangensis TaxID=539206 RepID=UPI00210D8E8E|nr:hypothetical protein [Pedobacter xinjiangensis]
MKLKKLLILLIFFCGLLACKKEDYSDRVFRTYLAFEIDSAENFHEKIVEGVSEGQYKPGSKSLFLVGINEAKAVYSNQSSSQAETDSAYFKLKRDMEAFNDFMNPYVSALRTLVTESRELLDNTHEGSSEGEVEPGAKAVFEAEILKAQDAAEKGGLTQKQVNILYEDLLLAFTTFEGKIAGAVNVKIVNNSFEGVGTPMPITSIPGWNSAGPKFAWLTKVAGSVSVSNAPDGRLVLYTGAYINPIWQQLKETVHPGSKYTLSFKADIQSSPANWTGAVFNTFVRAEVIVFNGATGDLNNITVLSTKDHNLGISKTPIGFNEFSQVIDIPESSPLNGKPMGIRLLTFEDHFVVTEEIWSETWIYLDDVKMKRAKD